ncbi:bifunctional folylpolyglutamate synthase/dihydrofolate synthase [Bacteroidales bacterium OttesenSCG-928-B11]|nr:bifunctional folylpolyglutamate synthase/dihydrofolate synthase [Bacteroidales bacterium OttesenSCG-928-B11]MDL2326369.1 bifunctional folylpolyglutamate synthase/dihydrofolate synthase [Bacteroidales bacterium OttesenSCG-928-A14]
MYKELLQKLFSAFPMYHKQGTSAYKEGLENIEELAAMAGHPERKFKSIHVAGTNGKGSVAHLLASCFQEAGYKTALFTSPHLVDFSERIKIDGEQITEKRVLDFFNRYQSDLDRISPSFFEMTTVLAFDYFAAEKVDIAIIEVGLGGRLDSTNIIHPILSVITNISKDHTQLLGSTITEIAREKGGVIKEGVPVVVGETDAESKVVFSEIATKKKTQIYFADEKTVDNTAKSQQIQGDYQKKNIRTFICCTDVLRNYFSFPEDIIEKSIDNLYKNTGLSGRWQILNEKPLAICDVGHNIGAFEITLQQLLRLNRKRVHFVFGMVNDKDIDAVISLFPKDNFLYYCCKADNDRLLAPEVLEEKLKAKGLQTVLCDRVGDAYTAACQAANAEDIIFVGGSFFVVGELLMVDTRNHDAIQPNVSEDV